MKKSMILAAAVVAAGLGASANATFFRITDASTNGSNILGNFNLQTDTVASVISTAGATDITAGTGGIQALNSTAVGDITAMVNAALGAVTTTPRLTYFGMNSGGGGGEGYFGVLFQNNGTARDWSVSIGQAAAASKGIFTNEVSSSAISTGTFQTQMGVFGNPQVAANGVYVAIFAGMGVGAQIGGSNLSDSNFNVHYLNFDGTNYGSFVSAAGANTSSINAAAYSIPVPAPALLAGAGLIGAAAIRRRMAKKA